MPPSKNPKWYYLNYGESVKFKLIQIGSELDDKGKLLRFLAKPIYTHIRDYPFPNGRKTMACAGERCEACLGGHQPTKFFPVHILVGDKEYIMDMTSTAHGAITEEIDSIVARGGTEDDVLQTEFILGRLQRREKPYFVCTIVQSETELTPEELEISKITEKDMEILRAISDQLKKNKDIKNPRGSVILTLRKKYDWPDIKINKAFEDYLDDYGFFRESEPE
jgi:hypothetical protein